MLHPMFITGHKKPLIALQLSFGKNPINQASSWINMVFSIQPNTVRNVSYVTKSMLHWNSEKKSRNILINL